MLTTWFTDRVFSCFFCTNARERLRERCVCVCDWNRFVNAEYMAYVNTVASCWLFGRKLVQLVQPTMADHDRCFKLPDSNRDGFELPSQLAPIPTYQCSLHQPLRRKKPAQSAGGRGQRPQRQGQVGELGNGAGLMCI